MLSKSGFRMMSFVLPMVMSGVAPAAMAQWSHDRPAGNAAAGDAAGGDAALGNAAVGDAAGGAVLRGLPDQMRLKLASIPDVTMGGVRAATMLVPEGWNFQGHIEWRGSPAPFAQRLIQLTSNDGCEMEFPSILSFQYGDNGYQQHGVAAPQDGGQWIAQVIAQRPGASNVRVLRADRDPRAEQAFVEKMSGGGMMHDVEIQSWVVRASFDQNGRSMTEEVSFMLMIGRPLEAAGLVTQSWSAIIDVASRAPSGRFEAMRPVFQMVFRSLRSDPRWHARQMEIRTQMLRQQTYDMIEFIRQQAAQYNQKPSDEALADWRRQNAADDEAQRRRINAIGETHDYADVDGTRVNVPIHYKSVFGDGSGNYVLTNNSYQPGGEFRELQLWK